MCKHYLDKSKFHGKNNLTFSGSKRQRPQKYESYVSYRNELIVHITYCNINITDCKSALDTTISDLCEVAVIVGRAEHC